MLDLDGSTIPPAEFMPSAERTGMATALDRWVIVSALKRLGEQRKEHPDTVFFIKLSVGTLQDAEMLPWISEKIKEARMPAENLVFQLKEAIVVNHLKQAKEFVKGLRALRCQFGLEDFGSGLNPFQLLKHLAVDFIKIDGAFVADLNDNHENQETIRSLTDTAHSMNKLVIVPQVGDPNTLSVLWGVGANFIQGNFLQEPSEDLSYDFSTMA
jgi:EAL domain-containing protein (putative c-di-GMP-specific phosphodiesterase class I)